MTTPGLAPLVYAVAASLALILSVGATLVLMASLTPSFRRDLEPRLADGGPGSFLAGLAVLAHAAVAALLLVRLGPMGRAGIVLLATALVGLTVVGLSAVAIRLGRRVAALRGPALPPSDLVSVLTGSIVLLLTAFLPLFGWVVATYAAVLGLGATTRALLGRAAAGARGTPVPAPGPLAARRGDLALGGRGGP